MKRLLLAAVLLLAVFATGCEGKQANGCYKSFEGQLIEPNGHYQDRYDEWERRVSFQPGIGPSLWINYGDHYSIKQFGKTRWMVDRRFGEFTPLGGFRLNYAVHYSVWDVTKSGDYAHPELCWLDFSIQVAPEGPTP